MTVNSATINRAQQILDMWEEERDTLRELIAVITEGLTPRDDDDEFAKFREFRLAKLAYDKLNSFTDQHIMRNIVANEATA